MGENLGWPGSSAANRDNLASLLDTAAGVTGRSVWHLWALWLWRHIHHQAPTVLQPDGTFVFEGDIGVEKQILEI